MVESGVPRGAFPAVLLLSAAVLSTANCGGCTAVRRGPPPERFVPSAVRAAVFVPETGRAAEELAALHSTISGFPGAAELAGFRGALAAQLGFDPLDREALEDAGLDPRRGAALALLAVGEGTGPNPTLLVLPVSDPPRFEALLARLARERLGAEVRATQQRGPATVVVFRAAATAPAALSYVIVERTALVAPGAAGPALVGDAAALGPERALAASPAFGVARDAVGEAAAATVYVPARSPFLDGLWMVKDGLALGLGAGDGRLRARTAVLLGDREPSVRALQGDGAAARLAARLAPDAALVLRWDGDPAALGKKLLPMLPARERARLASRGVDPQTDLFDALAPGGAVALSLSPAFGIEGLSWETLRADPLRLVSVEAALPVRAGAEERLARAAEALAPPAGARGRRARESSEPPGATVRRTTPSGEIAWTVGAGRLVVAGGAAGKLEALLARLGGEGDGFEAPTPTADGALEGGLGGGVLATGRLVSSVRALAPEAFGTGPSGFVMRSVVDRIVDPAARLSAISLEAELAPGALVVAVEVEAREGKKARR
jgi:hypothetical protein